MFHHGYVFQTMLAESGTLRGGQVRRHRTMPLLYGVNRPFCLRLPGGEVETRLCLVREEQPYSIEGPPQWLLCYYLYPDSPAGQLLRRTQLGDAAVSHFPSEKARELKRPDLRPSAGQPLSPFAMKRLLEQLIFLFTGARAVPRPETPFLREIRRCAAEEEILSAEALARAAALSREELGRRFARDAGIDADRWLLHRRLIAFFDEWERTGPLSAEETDGLCRRKGIAGAEGLDRLFGDLFGLSYADWTALLPGSTVLTDRSGEFPHFVRL